MKYCLRILVVITVLYCLGLTLPASAQSQATLSAQELWTYGRGVIGYFTWSESKLILSTSGGVWQVAPIGDQEPSRPISGEGVFRLSTSPDGTHFITYDADDFLLWNAQTNTILTSIPSHGYIESDAVAWQPNSNLLATIGYDEETSPDRPYRVDLWDISTGERTATIGNYELIVALTWHPNGEMLAVRQNNGTITIENTVSGEQIQELTADAINASTIAWNPDGSMLAATSDGDSPVKLWRTETFEAISAPNQPSFILSLMWNADSTKLAGSLVGSGVGVWNVETGELISLGVEAEDAIDRMVMGIAWDGNLLAALDYTQHLRVWSVESGELVWDSTDYQFHSSLRAIAVSYDGALVAVGYNYAMEIPILDGATGRLMQTLSAPRLLYRINDMAWSPSSEQLAVSTNDLFIWSLTPDAPATPIEVDEVNNFSWSADGVLAVTEDGQDELRLIDANTGEPLDTPDVSRVGFARWSPDGQYVAIFRYNPPSDDATIPEFQIDVWQVQRNLTVTMYFPHDENEERLMPSPDFVWLPDSSGLVGYTEEGALWRWPIGYQEAEIIVPAPQEDMTNHSFPLSINARGDLLAVSNPTTNGQIHILDVESGELLLALDDLASAPGFFAWGGDDRLFVYDGILHAYLIQAES